MDEWGELLGDLLNKIDSYLDLYDDKVRSRCVCTHWESSMPQLPDPLQQQPCLLLPYTYTGGGSLCGLYYPFNNDEVYDINLPEAGEKFFLGSGHGWVVSAQENGSIYVVNPLSRIQLALPPRYKFPDVLSYCPDHLGTEYQLDGHEYWADVPFVQSLSSYWVRTYMTHKIALSCTPTSNSCVAVAIYGGTYRLAYCKLGDQEWSPLVEESDTRGNYKDITFCDGKLYAVTNRLELMICDDIASCPKLKACVPFFRGLGDDDFLSLINSSDGGLMAVSRIGEDIDTVTGLVDASPPAVEEDLDAIYASTEPAPRLISKTIAFELCKLDMTRSSWIPMESLACDEILFMGLGSQFGIKRTDGNRIYFTTDKLDFKCQDIEYCFDDGIFTFEDKKFKPLGYKCDPQIVWPCPIWFKPDPY